MFYVYALVSDKDGTLYIGQTDNIDRRVAEHNSGKTKSIKSKIPFRLIYSEEFEIREDAVKRERKLKSGYGREFLKEHIKS